MQTYRMDRLLFFLLLAATCSLSLSSYVDQDSVKCDGISQGKHGQCIHPAINIDSPNSWPCTCRNGMGIHLNVHDNNNHAVECGENIDKSNMQTSPSVTVDAADKNKKYVLVMADPDAPDCKGVKDFLCYWMHWVLADIPGSSLTKGSPRVGSKELLSYTPPTPPSGTHRYQLFLFEERPGTHFDPSNFDITRDRFDLNTLIDDLDLCVGLVATFQFTSSVSD